MCSSAHGSRAAASRISRGGEGLAHPGLGADHHRGEHQRHRHRPATRVQPEGEGVEQVDGAALGQRPRLRLGLVHRLVTDPQHQPALVDVGVTFWPDAAQRAAQTGRDPATALGHVTGGHPGG